MKKIPAILLAGVMIIGCVSCGRTNNNNNNTQNDTQSSTQNQTEIGNGTGAKPTTGKITITDAKDVLVKVWDKYEDKDTDNNMYNDKFPILGGHFESYTEDAPGAYDITKTADLEKSFCFPAEKISLVDDVATMVHLMHANTFSASVYHVTDALNVNEVVNAIEDCVVRNQWLDGDPDDLVIVTIGEDYVLVAFGEDDLIDYFRAGIKTVYGDMAKVVVQRDID